MQRFHAQAAVLLFVGRRDPSSFPARILRDVVRSVVSMTVIVLMSGAAEFAGEARAEPDVAAQPRAHLPPIPMQALSAKLRSDSACRLPGSAP
jgi:hypothetical protein